MISIFFAYLIIPSVFETTDFDFFSEQEKRTKTK